MRIRTKVALLITLALPALSGCGGYGPWAKKVSAFSTSAPPALVQATAAYQSANDVHTLEEEAVLVDRYATHGYHPGELTVFMSQSDLASRQQAITVLTDYATLVGDLVLGKREQDVATKTKALSQGATAAKTATTSTSKTKTLTPQQMSYILSGLDMAIKPVIQHKVHKDLPASLAKADPYVAKLCSLLAADMDDLLSQEKADYQVLLQEQSMFIRKNASSMSAIEKRNEVLKLLTIEQSGVKADADLQKAQKALQEIASAHHRLVDGEKK